MFFQENRIIGKNARIPVHNVEGMLKVAQQELRQYKPDLNLEALRDEFEDKKKEVIYHSKEEQENFFTEIQKDIAGKTDAEILAALRKEIQDELFEAEVKKEGEDFEGINSSPINSARRSIQAGFEQGVAGMNTDQRKSLEQYTLDLVGAAAKNTEGKDHFANLETTGFLGDLMVTEAEAKKIAKLVRAKAKEIKEGGVSVSPPSAGEVTNGDPQARLEKATGILQREYVRPDWYVEGAATVDSRIAKSIEEKGTEITTAVMQLEAVGVKTTEKRFKEALGAILTQQKNNEGGGLASFLANETKRLTKKIEVRSKYFFEHLQKRYPGSEQTAVNLLLGLKKISSNDIGKILEYVAYGDIKGDITALADYVNAQNELTDDDENKINVNPAFTVENTLDAITEEAGSMDELMQGTNKLAKSLEAFQDGEIKKGFELLFESFSIVKTLWAETILKIAQNIPAELQPDFLKEQVSKAEATLALAQKQQERPILFALGKLFTLDPQSPDMENIRQDLNKITLSQLAELNDSEKRKDFLNAENAGFKMSLVHFHEIYKGIFEGTDKPNMNIVDGNQSVFEFLQTEIKKNPDYLG